MKLSFYARREHRCNARPGAGGVHGQAIKYIGVNWDDAKKCAVPSPEPFTFEADRSPTSKALAAKLLQQMCSVNGRKDPPLWPADEETARACGRPFIKTKPGAGGWHVPAENVAINPATRTLAPEAARTHAPTAPVASKVE